MTGPVVQRRRLALLAFLAVARGGPVSRDKLIAYSGTFDLDFTAYAAYNECMAILTIRNLPPEVHARLRIRAARAGRSMEAEVRAILAETCHMTEDPHSGSDLQECV